MESVYFESYEQILEEVSEYSSNDYIREQEDPSSSSRLVFNILNYIEKNYSITISKEELPSYFKGKELEFYFIIDYLEHKYQTGFSLDIDYLLN